MGRGGPWALEAGVTLPDMLAGAPDFPAVLEQFSARRFERCKFVQDASRRFGEAGAAEDGASRDSRHARMRETAQHDVDRFYQRIAEPA